VCPPHPTTDNPFPPSHRSAVNAVVDRYGPDVEVVIYAAWSAAFSRALGTDALVAGVAADGGVRLELARSTVMRQFGLTVPGGVRCVDLKTAWLLSMLW